MCALFVNVLIDVVWFACPYYCLCLCVVLVQSVYALCCVLRDVVGLLLCDCVVFGCDFLVCAYVCLCA